MFKEEPKSKRPKGVTFIIILSIFAIFVYASSNFGMIYVGMNLEKFSEYVTEQGILGVYSLGQTIALSVATGGLWSGREWARKLLIILGLISIVVSALTYFVTPESWMFLVFSIITELIIILYLGKSNVKEYFKQNEKARMTR